MTLAEELKAILRKDRKPPEEIPEEIIKAPKKKARTKKET